MKAGSYAVFNGEVFDRLGPAKGSKVTLIRSLSDPRPDGFEESSRCWRRTVDRSDVSRMFVVSTVAVWQGLRVVVESVWEDQATVSATSHARDIPRHPAVVRDNDYGDWHALVPVWELSEVVETVHDLSP